MPATPPAMLDTPPAPQIRGAFLADEPKLVGLGEALERRAHIARLGDHGDCGEGAAAATAADRVAEHDRQQYDQRPQDVLLAVEEPSERHEEDRPAPTEYRVPPSRRRPHLLVSLEIDFPVRTEEFGKVRPNPLWSGRSKMASASAEIANSPKALSPNPALRPLRPTRRTVAPPPDHFRCAEKMRKGKRGPPRRRRDAGPAAPLRIRR